MALSDYEDLLEKHRFSSKKIAKLIVPDDKALEAILSRIDNCRRVDGWHMREELTSSPYDIGIKLHRDYSDDSKQEESIEDNQPF